MAKTPTKTAAKKPAAKTASKARPDPQSGMDATQADPEIKKKAVKAQFAAADADGQPGKLSDHAVGLQVRGY